MIARACYLVLALTCLSLTAPALEWKSDEYKCAMTFPEDWETDDSSDADTETVFMARKTDGSVSMMLIMEQPASDEKMMDETTAARFDKGITEGGDMKKTSGRVTQFQGLAAYEFRGAFTKDDVQVYTYCMTFIANGYVYIVVVYAHGDQLDDAAVQQCYSWFSFVSPSESDATPAEWTSAEYKCSVTLPKGWELLDKTNLPSATAFMVREPKGTLAFGMMVQDVPAGVKADKNFVKGFEQGFSKSGGSKKSGEFTTFLNLPAYEFTGVSKVQGMEISVHSLSFAANGFIYALVFYAYNTEHDNDPVKVYFSGFKFTSPPELPAGETLAYKIGQYFGYVLVVLIALAIARWALKRKA